MGSRNKGERNWHWAFPSKKHTKLSVPVADHLDPRTVYDCVTGILHCSSFQLENEISQLRHAGAI